MNIADPLLEELGIKTPSRTATIKIWKDFLEQLADLKECLILICSIKNLSNIMRII